MQERYFLGRNGTIYTGTDIAQALYIWTKRNVRVSEISKNDLYLLGGIKKEIFNPTVEDFIRAGQIIYATKVYYDSKVDKTSGKSTVSLKEAYDYVNSLCMKMKNE